MCSLTDIISPSSLSTGCVPHLHLLKTMKLTSILFESADYWIDGFLSPEAQAVVEEYAGKITCNMGSLACQDMSRAWAKKFKRAGIEDLEMHHGTYKGEGHTWLQVDGTLFDPTAAQFSDFPDIDDTEYTIHEIEDY